MLFYPFDDDPPPRREIPWGALSGVPYGATTAAARALREFRPGITRDRRKREASRLVRRDLVIRLCHEVGLSNRAIAEVFRNPVGEVSIRKILEGPVAIERGNYLEVIREV